MKIMLDTNIVIDILEKREPFFANSYLVLLNALENGDLCMMPVSAATDIAYILRKAGDVKDKLLKLSYMISLTDVTADDFNEAVKSDMPDFEDALLAACAKRNKADCLVTRNAKDFAKSPVRAITPKQFLKDW